MKVHTVKVYYCPRCSRQFYDLKSNAKSFEKMETHVKTAHPDYWPMYKEGA